MGRLQTLRELIERYLFQPIDPQIAAKRYHPVVLLRLAFQIGRQWARDQCPQKAAMLAFQTILSIVPLIAVSFALLHALSLLDARSAIVDFFSHHVLPVSGDTITTKLTSFAHNIRTGALGTAGVVFTLGLAFLLFYTIEAAYNDIWRVGQRRSFVGKFTVFYPVATLSPVLIGIGLYYTARFWRAGGILGVLAPMGPTFTAFLLLNKLLPKTRVRWSSACAGALISAVLFEAAKRGFQVYVSNIAAASFSGTYGHLGVIPLFFIWVFYTWLVVLFGVEVAYTMQNLPRLEAAEQMRLDSPTRREELSLKVNGATATRLLCSVADHFASGRKALPKQELVRRHKLSDEVVEEIFKRLKDHDLAVEVFGEVNGYLPAKPLQELGVHEVLQLFDGAALDIGGDDALGRLQLRLRETQQEMLADLTFADLVQPGGVRARARGDEDESENEHENEHE